MTYMQSGRQLEPQQGIGVGLLDTIGNQKARTVLAALSQEPRSALELVDDLEFSRATIYRRLDELATMGLVTEETRIARDGNHQTVFDCNFERTLVTLEDDSYDVQVVHRTDPGDRFADLWDDLGQGTR